MLETSTIILVVSLIFLGFICIICLKIVYHRIWPGLYMLLQIQKLCPKNSCKITIQKYTIPSSMGEIPVKIFTPKKYNKILVVITGMYYLGYEDERLIEFCSLLAGFDMAVVAPDIADIKNYRFSQQTLVDIERTVVWTLEEAPLLHTTKKVGLMGFSYSGGLCLIVAKKTSLEHLIELVFAFGSHADLDHLLQYLTTGKVPNGTFVKPQSYGEAVIAIELADQFANPQDAHILRECMLHFLCKEPDLAKSKKELLPPNLQQLVQWCLDDDSLSAGAFLHPYVSNNPKATFLSPIRFQPPKAPVMLLHGKGDNLIPLTETEELIKWCKPLSEDYIISGLVDHVEVEITLLTLIKDVIPLCMFFSRFIQFRH